MSQKDDYHWGETWGLVFMLVTLYPFMRMFKEAETGFAASFILGFAVYFLLEHLQRRNR